jgi:hypothetical protein
MLVKVYAAIYFYSGVTECVFVRVLSMFSEASRIRQVEANSVGHDFPVAPTASFQLKQLLRITELDLWRAVGNAYTDQWYVFCTAHFAVRARSIHQTCHVGFVVLNSGQIMTNVA